ncbi:zinc finger CCCH domain-containing protein 66 isoform X4 [Cryptomeria japonica]|uniref:zinc finger CCCH domain-containing protein 66 isoform X4 n=1 Tax=Cryptomeria japonica TaxID=3369 RepID=UPI0025AC59B5|nr:zinc finger CCCH domain-containing protein 66 isoform X4 [Cryptomeria japonica]
MEYNVGYGRQQQQQGRSFDPSGSEQQQYGRPRVTLAVNTAAGIEDAMWQMTLQPQYEGAEADMGPYPERPGEPDCSYYMRTGLCGYGMGCRFNHPPNRKQATSAARNKGEYPERPGQPECQYYMKTGTCKFGGSCKFHHPRDKAGMAGRTTLNVLGYPLRPNEKDCAYYLRTGQCKYGATCKFHHPQPVSALVPVRGTSLFTPVHSPSTPGPQPYPGGLPTWPIARAPFIQSPRWQGPSSYASVILPQGLVSVPSWSSYPGAPACGFYTRYGICKFGPTCKFDHPMGSSIPLPIDVPVGRHLLGSSSSALVSGSLSSELPVESGAGIYKERASKSDVHQQSSGAEDLGADE